ncbi:DEAD/DEAH box helicase [Brevibacillus sp. SYP-B805]|nr:DEAD/DEAH box helicase [Brevibacillus sp. SYP-B805]
MGFEEATPIQEKVIPLALSGADLIGQAQTGTGKTAAFSIPLIEKIDVDSPAIQGLVLAPTRELAIQVAEELSKFGVHKGVRHLPIYGGQDIGRQIRALKNRPHVIIATPGRLIDHLERRTIRLQEVHTVVLDEADEMLNMGFLEEIQKILTAVPADRQTMLFSATMPAPIRKLADQFLKHPEHIAVTPKVVQKPTIAQFYCEVAELQKFDTLCRLIDIEGPDLAIIFGRTKRRVDELAAALQKRGYLAEGLHGDLSQHQRDAVMRKFREGQIEILVATDVAARGLDVSNVTHVYNFDIPQDPESYVHRVGRTGRAGRTGVATTFVTPRETEHLHFIERINQAKIKKRPVPTIAEAISGQMRGAVEKIVHTLEAEKLDPYVALANDLLDEHDANRLVAAALKLLTRETSDVPVELTPEKPLRTKRSKPPERKFGGSGERRGFRPREKEAGRRLGGSKPPGRTVKL